MWNLYKLIDAQIIPTRCLYSLIVVIIISCLESWHILRVLSNICTYIVIRLFESVIGIPKRDALDSAQLSPGASFDGKFGEQQREMFLYLPLAWNNELTYLSEERREFSLATRRARRGEWSASTSSVRKLSSRALLITLGGSGGGGKGWHAHLHFPEGPFRSYSATSSPGSGSAVI